MATAIQFSSDPGLICDSSAGAAAINSAERLEVSCLLLQVLLVRLRLGPEAGNVGGRLIEESILTRSSLFFSCKRNHQTSARARAKHQ